MSYKYHRGDKIVLPYFLCWIREYKHKGIYRISKPKRKDRFGHWESYWQVEQTIFSDPKGLSDCVFYLNRKAQRIINLNAQQYATKQIRFIRDDEAREKFRSWVDKRYGHLSEIYREENTTIYGGGMDNNGDIETPFHQWVPSFLAKRDMDEELSIYKEKKQSLGVKW